MIRVEFGNSWVEIFYDNRCLYRGPQGNWADEIVSSLTDTLPDADIEYVEIDFKD
jgi:hypothetical protein